MPKSKNIIKASEYPEVEFMPTGIPVLDKLITGLPLGRMVTISGLPSSAKTSLSLYLIAQAQKQGIKCAFVDAEQSFNPTYTAGLGVDLKQLELVVPDYGEEALEAMEELLTSGKVQLIVVDSVPALSVRAEQEANYEASQMALQARFMSRALRKLTPIVKKNNAVIIWINQLRANILGGTYDRYIETGGEALKFYSSIGLRLTKTQFIKIGDKLSGITVKVKVRKNKVGEPDGETSIELRFNQGFRGEVDAFEEAIEKGEVVRKGHSYYVGDTKLATGKEASKEIWQKKQQSESTQEPS